MIILYMSIFFFYYLNAQTKITEDLVESHTKVHTVVEIGEN